MKFTDRYLTRGSRKMTGQLNVEDNNIAAAANASAPNMNNPLVIRRIPPPVPADGVSGCAAPRPAPCAVF